MKENYLRKETIQGVEVFKVVHDTNGNPRYVVHFMELLTKEEKESSLSIGEKYNLSLSKARKQGGKIYRAQWFGGGIVFQTYNIEDTINKIFK